MSSLSHEVDPQIAKLLTLQEHDTRRLDIERQLASIPAEIAALEKQIAQKRSKMEETRSVLKGKEMRRHEMRTERLANEDQIAKYKTQQLQVKKNDEYQALTHEIEELTQRCSAHEEEEIALLLEIDTVAEEVAEREKETQEAVAALEKKISALKAQEAEAKKAHEAEQATLANLAQDVSPKYLRAYENVKRRYKRPPFVIPIIDHKASGLRVSGEVESAARRKDDVATDEMSGRIVYLPD